MLLYLRNSFNSSHLVAKGFIAFLIFLLAFPNLIGLFSSTNPVEDIIVASSPRHTVSLKQLHQKYPEQVSAAFQFSNEKPEYTSMILERTLEDLALRDYVKEQGLLPSIEELWPFLRMQAQSRLSEDERSSISLEELDQEVHKLLPPTLEMRQKALENMRYNYAFHQLSKTLQDFSMPVQNIRQDTDFLLREYLFYDYVARVSDFLPLENQFTQDDFQNYYQENQSKYYTETVYQASYQSLSFLSQELVALWSEKSLREELEQYDISRPSDEEIIDFAHVKMNNFLNDESSYDIDQQTRIKDFIQQHLSPRTQTEHLSALQLEDKLGNGIQASMKHLDSLDDSRVLDISQWLVNDNTYFLVSSLDRVLSRTLTFQEALSDVKNDFLYSVASSRCHKVMQELQLQIQEGPPIELADNKWKNITLKKIQSSLHSHILTSLDKDKKIHNSKAGRAFTLFHPELSQENSTDLAFDKMTDTFSLLVYHPQNSSERSVVSTELSNQVEHWLNDTLSQNTHTLFTELLRQRYGYTLQKSALTQMFAEQE